MRSVDVAAGALCQFIATGDRCYLDNSDPDELREMVVMLVAAGDEHPDDPGGCYCPEGRQCDSLCHHPQLRATLERAAAQQS